MTDWYQSLVDDCRSTITTGRFNSAMTLVETYHLVGKRITTDKNYQKHSKGNGSSLQGLAKSVGVSNRTLYYAVKFYEECPDLNSVTEFIPNGHISWNRIIGRLDGREEKQYEPCPTCGRPWKH